MINYLMRNSFNISQHRDQHHHETQRRNRYQIKQFTTTGESYILHSGLILFKELPHRLNIELNLTTYKKQL